MCAKFRCLWSWRYSKRLPGVLLRTGIAGFWINWAGYCHLAAWAGVMTLTMEVVRDVLRRAIGPGSVSLSTLGDGGYKVCVTLNLVFCAMHSYFSRVYGTLGADGDALGIWINTLVREAWGWTVD